VFHKSQIISRKVKDLIAFRQLDQLACTSLFFFLILLSHKSDPMSSSTDQKQSGPKGHFILGMVSDFRNDPLVFTEEMERDFPGLCGFKFAHLHMILVNKPEYIQHVLQTNNKNYVKGIEYDELKHILGDGLLTSEGSFWLRQRRLAQPAFHKKRLAHFVEMMVSSTEQLLLEWNSSTNEKEAFDVLPEMMRLTLDIVSRTMFSTHVNKHAPAIAEALGALIHDAYGRIESMVNVPLWFPTKHNNYVVRQRKVLQNVILNLIEERRNSGESMNDLLSMLMEAEDEDTGERMTDKQLMDELMTIFLAGHETTANALSWTLYLLSENPEVEQCLLEEVTSVLGNEAPTLESVRSLNYTMNVLKESMRLYPPAWMLGRTALQDDEVDCLPIAKGSNILISTWALHRSERYWEEPLAFKPERFEQEKDIPKFAYFPFGGGPRLCIGTNFANMEMQIVLAMLVREYSFSLKEDHPVEPEPLVTLRPKHGLQFYARKRKLLGN